MSEEIKASFGNNKPNDKTQQGTDIWLNIETALAMLEMEGFIKKKNS